METGKRTYRGIINKGYEIKSNMIEAAQQRLSAQQQEIQQKRQQLNMNIKEAKEQIKNAPCYRQSQNNHQPQYFIGSFRNCDHQIHHKNKRKYFNHY